MLALIVYTLSVLAASIAVYRWENKLRSGWPEPLSAVDEQLAGLSRRYVHGDLTLEEFEEQIDQVLNGKLPNPWPTTYVTYADVLGNQVASGTARYYPKHGGTAYL